MAIQTPVLLSVHKLGLFAQLDQRNAVRSLVPAESRPAVECACTTNSLCFDWADSWEDSVDPPRYRASYVEPLSDVLQLVIYAVYWVAGAQQLQEMSWM